MRLFSFVYCLLLTFSSSVAFAGDFKNSLAAAWFDETHKELKIIDGYTIKLDSEVQRLEKEYRKAQKQIKDEKNCVKLNCLEIEKLSKQIYEALATANASVAMSRIAREELMSLAENQRKSLTNMERGKDTLANHLFLHEALQRTAHLSAGLAISLMTGSMGDVAKVLKKDLTGKIKKQVRDEIWKKQMSYAASSMINYSFNRGADMALGHKKAAGGKAQYLAGTEGKGGFIDTFVGSVGSQLTSFSVASAKNLTPTKFLKGLPVSETNKLVPTFKHLANAESFKMGATQAAQLASRAIVHAFTEQFVKKTRVEFEKALKEYEDAFKGQRDYELSALFGKVAIEMAKDRRQKITALADRINKLAVNCKFEASKNECGKKLEAALKRAKDKYNKTTATLKKENKIAQQALDQLRHQWRKEMIQTAEYHEQLQIVRDDLIDAKRLQANRQKLEDLAKSARDASKRGKYKAELERLKKLDSVENLAAREKDLVAKHKQAWNKIDALIPAMKKAGTHALAVYNKNNNAIEEAEKIYMGEISKAHSDFYACLETKVSAVPEAANPTLKEMRKKLTQEVDPNFIYFALNKKIKELGSRAGKTKITAHKNNGDLCGPEDKKAAAPSMKGTCWTLSSLFDNEAFVQKKNDTVNATVFSGKNSMVYEGTLKDGQLYLEHTYTEADRGFLRGWIDERIGAKFIDKLISLKAKAVIKGTMGEGQPREYLTGPTPALGDSYPHQLMTGTHKLLNYNLKSQNIGGFESSVNNFDASTGAEFCDGYHCLFEFNGPRLNPSFFAIEPQGFLSGNAKWLQLDPVWKHVGYINVMDKGFKESEDGIFDLGDKIAVEADSDFNCKRRQDEITLRIEPEKTPVKGFNIVLKETSKDSGIYRSTDGVKLDFSKKDVIDGFQGNINLYIPEQKKYKGSFPMTIPIFKQ